MGMHATGSRKLGENGCSDRGRILREVPGGSKQSCKVPGRSKQLVRAENEECSEADDQLVEEDDDEIDPEEECSDKLVEEDDDLVDEEEDKAEVENEEEGEAKDEDEDEDETETEEEGEAEDETEDPVDEEEVEEAEEEGEIDEEVKGGRDVELVSDNCIEGEGKQCEEGAAEVEEFEDVVEEEEVEEEVEEVEEEVYEEEEDEKVDEENDNCEVVGGRFCEGALEVERFADVDEEVVEEAEEVEEEEEVEEVEEVEEEIEELEEEEEVGEVEEVEEEIEELEEEEEAEEVEEVEEIEELEEEEEMEDVGEVEEEEDEGEAEVEIQQSKNCQEVEFKLCKEDTEEAEKVEGVDEEVAVEQPENCEETEVKECEELKEEVEEEDEEVAAKIEGSCEQQIAVKVGETCGKHIFECQTTVTTANEIQSDITEKKLSEIVTLPSIESKEMFDHVPLPLNENKRMADVTLSSSGKKLKETVSSSSSDMQDKSATKSGGCQTSGSSGKKRPSRWDLKPEDDKGDGEGHTEVTKRKKTRWTDDDAELKMIGPLQLPDFTKGLGDGTKQERSMKKLNEQLLGINQELLNRNTSDLVCTMLIAQKQKIISKLVEGAGIISPLKEKHEKLYYRKLYIPVKEFPDFNFIGLIMGPGGKNQKKMESETGAKILLRGKGSVKENTGNHKSDPSDLEDLHIRIEADDEGSLNAAVSMVEKLLVPQSANSLKLEQLREIALMKRTLDTNEQCQICGDKNHSTRYCPLTTRSPSTDGQPGNSGFQIADGFFSSFCGRPGSGNNTSGIVSDDGNKIVQQNKPSDASNLYVGGLPENIDEAALFQLFSSFGSIEKVRVVRGSTTGLINCYGFVKYKSPACAAAAIKQMNAFQIAHKTLKVKVAGPSQAKSTVNAVNMPMGNPPSYLGSSHITIPQVAPCWPNAPAMMFPGYCMPRPQMVSNLANGFFIPRPYAAPMLPSPANMQTMEIQNFAGNPNKTATSLFSSISAKTPSGTYSKDQRALPPSQFTMSKFSHSPAHVSNVPPSETVSFPGNPEYRKPPYRF